MSGQTSAFAICILLTCFGISQLSFASGFNLVILHTNDVHSRIEQFNKYGSECSQQDATDGKCYGGVARRYTKIEEIRNTGDNVLLLDAGDQFFGTLWFTLYRGKATALFMERLGYDAMCFGNHEFDNGDIGVADFVQNVTFPLVSANIEVTSASPLYQKFTKSVTLTVGGEKIGIVGYTTEETRIISRPGKNVQFHDEISSVREEVNRLTGQGIDKIIALGHAGYDIDLEVAKIDGVDIVVGGHTNTFLYNGDPPSNEEPIGPYPTVVTQGSGKRALVVQDAAWGKYLGYLNVTFDTMGVVEAWSGNPIILDNTVSKDLETEAIVEEMKKGLVTQNSQVVGSSNVFLDGRREICRTQECNMANLITDSIIDYHLGLAHSNITWAPAAIAIWNGGGTRASIEKDVDVTIGDLKSVLPFDNEVDVLTVRGSNLREQLEHSVRNLNPQDAAGKFLQFSGHVDVSDAEYINIFQYCSSPLQTFTTVTLRLDHTTVCVVYDSRPAEQRVISVEVRCLECDIPSYSPLIDTAEYKILVSTFLAEGGDGFDFQPTERVRLSTVDVDIFIKYFQRHSPVIAELEGRITFKEPDETSAASTVKDNLSYIVLILLALPLKQG